MTLRSASLLTGIGTVGVGGTGLTFWQFYGALFGSENLGHLNSPISSGLGVFNDDSGNVLEPNTNAPKLNISSCFENFFPGVGKVEFEWDKSENSRDVTSPTISSEQTALSRPTTGCVLAQMAYLKNSDDSSDNLSKLIFKSELAFKNEKTGGVIWALWDGKLSDENQSHTWYQYLKYHVLFLESSNGSDGSIKGGYLWSDAKVSDPSNRDVYIEVGESVGIGQNSDSSSSGTGQKNEYMGFWKEGTEEGSGVELINAMELRSNKTGNTKCEILCKNQKDKTFDDIKKDGDEYRYFHQLVKGDGQKGIGAKEKKKKASDLISNLEAGYAPFKGKKGKGSSMNKNFCFETTSSQNKGLSDFEFRSLCYKR